MSEWFGADVATTGDPTATPMRALTRGLAAGAIATVAMTAAQSVYYRSQGTEPSTTPAEVAKRIIGGVFHRSVDEDKTEQLNNAMHWSYGTTWGAVYGVVRGAPSGPALRSGLVFGIAVWGASLIHLPAMKLAPPVWESSPSQIAPDVAFHLIYGATAGVAYAALPG